MTSALEEVRAFFAHETLDGRVGVEYGIERRCTSAFAIKDEVCGFFVLLQDVGASRGHCVLALGWCCVKGLGKNLAILSPRSDLIKQHTTENYSIRRGNGKAER